MYVFLIRCVYSIGVLQFAPNTSLGFVSNSYDATGTLTRHVKPSLHSSSPITTEPAVNAQASKQAGPPMTADKQLWHIHWYGRNINNMIYIDYGLPIL
ncbi:hypothetical protein DPX16_7823 [Anabarilius grahami]|uniref:Uncharacterized protein n=1 Tax=Anabarilius grahami TaxID=495550 RepID=A0A3N0XJP8_ANAGA|nr:hypothetical protein DPX16_7823 [Anabarilius grahami]